MSEIIARQLNPLALPVKAGAWKYQCGGRGDGAIALIGGRGDGAIALSYLFKI